MQDIKMKHIYRFASYARGVLIYTLLVILWGAFVRATGSGAGCGSHWPLCNGDIIPRAPQLETLIEFSHRLTSGFLGFLMLGLAIWAYRIFPRRHRVRYGAFCSLVFTIVEGLIGGAQVRYEMVAQNQSLARSIWQSAHLANTFMLVAALTLTVWWAAGGPPLRLRGQGLVGWLLGLGLVGTVILGVTGTIVALGDTLFPVSSFAEGVRQDFSPTAHFLIRLRILHPILAVILGIYLVTIAGFVRTERPSQATSRLARVLAALFVAQLGLGGLNVLLLAPIWMQLAHLLLADLVWITLVLLTAAALAQPQAWSVSAVPVAPVPYAEPPQPERA
jgi:heme A synthase